MQLCTARLHPKGTSPRCALRAPRLLRSLAMTNLGVLSSRVIARRAQARRGNLKQAVTNPPEAFLCSGRCCEIATAPLGPRNDKSGSIAPLNSCHQYCQPAWRSLSAATDAIGAYHFIGSHYESAASRRARLSAPLQHYIALQKGRTCSPALLYIIISFSFSRGYRRCTCVRRSPSTRHRCQNTGRSYCP
mgnify:FL=1